jgi:hypothetical protein
LFSDSREGLGELFQKYPSIETLMTKLERILHELWLQEFAWPSIEMFAPIYDLICDMMSQYGLIFVRHEKEWRIVMYGDRKAIEQAQKALDRWPKPSGHLTSMAIEETHLPIADESLFNQRCAHAFRRQNTEQMKRQPVRGVADVTTQDNVGADPIY